MMLIKGREKRKVGGKGIGRRGRGKGIGGGGRG